MKVKKTFLLDTFRRMSSTVKVFCSDTNLKFLILIFYKYTPIKVSLYKYIGEQLNYKKTLQVK